MCRRYEDFFCVQVACKNQPHGRRRATTPKNSDPITDTTTPQASLSKDTINEAGVGRFCQNLNTNATDALNSTLSRLSGRHAVPYKIRRYIQENQSSAADQGPMSGILTQNHYSPSSAPSLTPSSTASILTSTFSGLSLTWNTISLSPIFRISRRIAASISSGSVSIFFTCSSVCCT